MSWIFNPKYNREDEYMMSKCFTLLKNIGDKFYLPFFSGIGSNGVPTQYIRFIDYIIRSIYKIEEELNNEDYIKKLGFSCSKKCEFKLKLKDNRLYLFEQTRRECLRLELPEIF